MAALLPTILSEDEDESRSHEAGDANKRAKKKRKVSKSEKNKVAQHEVDDDAESDGGDGAVSDDEMDGDFEFGGLLGEDGPSFRHDALSTLSSLHDKSHSKNSWSYKSALALLAQNDNAGIAGVVERTSVASIIAAARSNLKSQRGKGDKDEGSSSGRKVEEDGNESSDDDSSDEGSGRGRDGSDNDKSSGSDDSDASDSDSSDDEVDDAHHATHSMESDALKIREKPQRSKKKKRDNKNEESSKKDADSNDDSSSGDDDDKSDDGDGSDESDAETDEEVAAEAKKAAAFFDSTHIAAQNDNDSIDCFSQLGLSRPLLRGVASMGFVTPTPIQASVLPVALAGRDVCASAVTGSGKTAAFLLPVMERILQRGGGRGGGAGGKKKQSALAATRALVLTPTRELAAQCVSMMTAMAQFTDLRAALIVGGAKNVMSQATELRTRPDVVVATPGRLLDHLTNSQGVDVDDLEFLVLDEADRLLDLGFQDEVHEIIKSCPVERQTMLFSATMSTKIDELIKLSLKRPVRIQATDKSNKKGGTESSSSNAVEVAPRLEQEFVRIRAGNEGVNREGMLLALLTRTFQKRVIVFFDTKSAAHRLMIVCGLCGIKCAELHGNLTQVQRLEALEAFREGSVDVLLATDLAARGLDISGVECVINFEMPSQVETYVHRIGRTARAGRGGKSCTLIGEGRRYLMKEVIKDAEEKSRKSSQNAQSQEGGSMTSGVIRSRTIPPAVVAHFVAKINSLEQHIREVMDAETVARMDRIAEMEAMRAKNIIEHSNEIKSRPQKEWFASGKQRLSVKEAAAERKRMMDEKAGTGTHRMTRKKRRAQEAREALKEAQEEARREAEESGRALKKTFSDASMKGSAKAARKKEAQKEKELASRSIHDDDLHREKKAKQKRKASVNSDALGDGGLFSEEKVSFAKKSKNEAVEAPAKSSYFFKEYDPNKKRSKKKSVNSFKSKSKYKRR